MQKYGSQESIDKFLQQFSLADSSYSKKPILTHDYTLVDQVCHGNVVDDCDKLRADIYLSSESPDDVFIAYRGSSHLSNWTTHNMPLVFKSEPKAYQLLADKSVKRTRELYPGKKLNFIGHSSGGYTALYSGMKYDGNVIAIDAPTSNNLIKNISRIPAGRQDQFKVINAGSIVSGTEFRNYTDKITLIELQPDNNSPLGYFYKNHSIKNISYRLRDHLRTESYVVSDEKEITNDPFQELASLYLYGKDKNNFDKVYGNLTPEERVRINNRFMSAIRDELKSGAERKLKEYKEQLVEERKFYNLLGSFAAEHIPSKKVSRTLMKISEGGNLLVDMRENLLLIDTKLPDFLNNAFSMVAAATGPIGIALSFASTILKLRSFIRGRKKSGPSPEMQYLNQRLMQLEGMIRHLHETMVEGFKQVLSNQQYLQILLAAGFNGIENILNENFAAISDSLFDIRVLQLKKNRELLLQDYRKTLHLANQVSNLLGDDNPKSLSPYMQSQLVKLLTKLEFWIGVESCSGDLTGLLEHSIMNERQVLQILGPRTLAKQQKFFIDYSTIDAFDYIGFLGKYAANFDGELFSFDENRLFNFRVWHRAVRIYINYADKIDLLGDEVKKKYQMGLNVISEQCENFSNFIDNLRYRLIGDAPEGSSSVKNELTVSESTEKKPACQDSPGDLLRYLQHEYALTIDKLNYFLTLIALQANYTSLASSPKYEDVIKPISHIENHTFSAIIKDTSDEKVEFNKILLHLKFLQYLIRSYLYLTGYGEEANNIFKEKAIFEKDLLETDLNLFYKPAKSGPPWTFSTHGSRDQYLTIRTACIQLDGNSMVYALIRNSTNIELYRYNLTAGDEHWQRMADGPEWSNAKNYNHDTVFHSVKLCVVLHHGQQFLYVTCRGRDGLVMSRYNPKTDQWFTCASLPDWSDANKYVQYEYHRRITILPISVKGATDEGTTVKILATLRGPSAVELFSYDTDANKWENLTLRDSAPRWADADQMGFRNYSYYGTYNAVVLEENGEQHLFVMMRIPSGIELFKYDVRQHCWQEKAKFIQNISSNGYQSHEATYTFNATVVNNELCISMRSSNRLELLIYNPQENQWRTHSPGPAWSDAKAYNVGIYYWTIQTLSFQHAGNWYLLKTIRHKNYLEIHLHDIKADKWFYLNQSPKWPDSKANNQKHNYRAHRTLNVNQPAISPDSGGYEQNHINLTIRADIIEHEGTPKLLIFIRDKDYFDMLCCNIMPPTLERSLELEKIFLPENSGIYARSEVEELVDHIKATALQLQTKLAPESNRPDEKLIVTAPTKKLVESKPDKNKTEISLNEQLYLAIANHNINKIKSLLVKATIFDLCGNMKDRKSIFAVAAEKSDILDSKSVYQLCYARLSELYRQVSFVLPNSQTRSSFLNIPLTKDNVGEEKNFPVKELNDYEKFVFIESYRVERQRQKLFILSQIATLNDSAATNDKQELLLREKINTLEFRLKSLENTVNKELDNDQRRYSWMFEENQALNYFYQVLRNSIEEYFISTKLLNAGYPQRASYTLKDKLTKVAERGAILMVPFGALAGETVGEFFIHGEDDVNFIQKPFKYLGELIHFAFLVEALVDKVELVEEQRLLTLPAVAWLFSNHEKLEKVGETGLTLSELSDAASDLAYEITVQYRTQIKSIKMDSDIYKLAMYTHDYILELLRSGNIECTKEQVVKQLAIQFENAELNDTSLILKGSNATIQTQSGIGLKCSDIFSKPRIFNIESQFLSDDSSNTQSYSTSTDNLFAKNFLVQSNVVDLLPEGKQPNSDFALLEQSFARMNPKDSAAELQAHPKKQNSHIVKFSNFKRVSFYPSVDSPRLANLQSVVDEWENLNSKVNRNAIPTDVSRKPVYSTYDLNLQKHGLMSAKMEQTHENSNGFFGSIFMQLPTALKANYPSLSRFKNAIVSHIDTYIEHYCCSVGACTMEPDNFIDVLKNSTAFTDYVLALAISRVSSCNLVIIRDDRITPAVFAQKDSIKNLLLGCEKGSQYSGLERNPQVKEPKNDMLKLIEKAEIDKENPLTRTQGEVIQNI